jgi:hypothetical protein
VRNVLSEKQGGASMGLIGKDVVCEDKKQYAEIAMALEILAYHNKNYLCKGMDNKTISEEVQYLLKKAVQE